MGVRARVRDWWRGRGARAAPLGDPPAGLAPAAQPAALGPPGPRPALGPPVFDAAVEAALAAGALPRLLRPLGPGVYELPLIDAGARAAWWAACESALRAPEGPGAPPNSMHEYGFGVEAIGGDAWAQRLGQELLSAAAGLFPGVEGPVVDVHAFIAAYGPGRDHALALHVDDSTLTLNVCLGDAFTGGEVVFEGVRCPAHRQEALLPGERVVWAPRPGAAVLHRGAHRHHVRPVESGRRTHLIVWGRVERRAELAGCAAWCESPSRR